MRTMISMLRGINVGGVKKISMPELKALYEALEFTNVKTYVQSGNVIFDVLDEDRQQAAARIEAGIEAKFGYELPVFIREAGDFQRLVKTNPFLAAREEDPAWLYVTFLYRSVDPAEFSKLASLVAGGDEYAPTMNEIFLFCPNGYGRTKLSNTAIESKLKTPATTRNWNTILALLAMAEKTH